MTLDELLPALTAYGARVSLERGEIRLSVPSRLPEEVLRKTLVPAIRANHDALVRLLRREDLAVQDRADWQLMLACENEEVAAHECLSCGARLTPGRTYRCAPCARAEWLMTQQTPTEAAA